MTAGNGYCGLPGMGGLLGNSMQQQWPGSDGFEMFLRTGEADKKAPPVIHQRHKTTDKAASFEILRCITTPAPLVFQFIKTVFTIGSIAIQLGNGKDFNRKRSDKHSILILFGATRSFQEEEGKLTGAFLY